MSWWTSEKVEPKRKSRFIVEIASGFILDSVKTCTKPSANIDLKEFQLINHKFKYPGVVTWNDIKITFIDKAGSLIDAKDNPTISLAVLFENMLKHTGYNIPTRSTGPISKNGPNRQLSATEKASTVANAFGAGLYSRIDRSPAQVNNSSELDGTNNQSIKIHMLDPSGTTSVESWTLHNPQIKSISWGDLAYDSDEFVEYSIDIAYDFATMKVGEKIPKIDNAAIEKLFVKNSGILGADQLDFEAPELDPFMEFDEEGFKPNLTPSEPIGNDNNLKGTYERFMGVGGGYTELDNAGFQSTPVRSTISEDYPTRHEIKKKDTAVLGVSYDESYYSTQEGPGANLAEAWYDKK